jgi:hypothetical protein
MRLYFPQHLDANLEGDGSFIIHKLEGFDDKSEKQGFVCNSNHN